jgi:hypothetical protein
MLPVLMLFLIPVGGGIPAGVLLARSHGIGWPMMEVLYLISDVILAFLFEPLLRLFVLIGRRVHMLARMAEVMRQSMQRTAAQYGSPGAGPFALVMVAFIVDPMTGRSAAMMAGHGFISGWAIAITGDMLYFTVLMVATLKLNSWLGDPTRAVTIVMTAMIVLPMLVRRFRKGARPQEVAPPQFR